MPSGCLVTSTLSGVVGNSSTSLPTPVLSETGGGVAVVAPPPPGVTVESVPPVRGPFVMAKLVPVRRVEEGAVLS